MPLNVICSLNFARLDMSNGVEFTVTLKISI